MEDYSIYGEITPADKEIAKALTGFKIESVGLTTRVERHCFDDDTKEEEIYNSRVEGGLTLILTDGKIKKKVILGYTEIGEWLEHEEIL